MNKKLKLILCFVVALSFSPMTSNAANLTNSDIVGWTDNKITLNFYKQVRNLLEQACKQKNTVNGRVRLGSVKSCTTNSIRKTLPIHYNHGTYE